MNARVSTIALGLVLAATSARAQAPYHWKPFVAVTAVSALDSSEARLGGVVGEFELSDELGWEAGFEWRLNRVLGIEASYARSEHTIDFGDAPVGEATFEPIYLALDLHFPASELFDAWAAPTVVYARFSEQRLDAGGTGDADSKSALGAAFGVDWKLGEDWALTLAVRYFDLQLDFGGGEIAVDPLVLRFGVAARL